MGTRTANAMRFAGSKVAGSSIVVKATLISALLSFNICACFSPAIPGLGHRLPGAVLSQRPRCGPAALNALGKVGQQEGVDVANTAVQATEKAITALQNVNSPPQVKMPAPALPPLPHLPRLGELQDSLAGVYEAHPVWTMASAFVAVLAFVVASGALPKKTTTPYPTGTYNFKSAELYFAERPATVVQRAAFISLSAAGWGLGVVIDVLTGSYKQNERRRADELTDLLTRLGPTFIKIGQSLSIRSDLLTPEYLRSLTSLQDKVPSFPTEIARQMISDELGKPCDSIFTGIDKPVAAASLGQVYKATLKDGRQVAVKVQRPQILEQIALDMHLIRITAPVIKALGAPGDVEGLVDDWGFGFVNEVDYLQEARNADVFMDGLKKTALAKVVFAPPVLRDLSSRRVLTTEWIDGERLEKSSAKDTGTMHCDPHPGNLLRTPDGRLCILDWGLVQEMPADLRLTMIEHIAHLVSRDYAKVPNDLVLLGFVPKGQEEKVRSSDSMRVIAETYTKLMAGGGAANIDVNAVFTDLQDLTSQYGNLFQIPPYFAYIARAFGVLEGIGLNNNPDYAIISECLPYISQRLLTDPNPRTAGALNTFIFGASKDDPERLINTKRVEQLLEGFGSYSTSTAAVGLAASGSRDPSASPGAPGAPATYTASSSSSSSLAMKVEAVADQVFSLLITEENTPLQAIVLEQLARVLSAGVRGSWKSLRDRSTRLPNGRSLLGTLVDPLGIFANSDLVALDETDKRALAASQRLVEILQKQTAFDTRELEAMKAEELRELATIVTRKLWQNRRVLALTTNRLAAVAVLQTLDRLEKGAAERGGISTETLKKVENRLAYGFQKVEDRLGR